MAFSYRNTYLDTVDRTNYTFSSCDLGTPGANRLVIVAVMTGSANPSAVTVDGVSATRVIESNAGDGAAELWQAATTANATGDIVVTVASALRCVIHVWAGYPASATAVDSASAEVNPATTVVLTDLAKTNAGFTVLFCLKNSVADSPATYTVTQTGAETVVENHDATIESGTSSVAASHVNTATTTTDDYTFTASASVSLRAVGASWGPEAASTITGTASITEAGDTIAATGTLKVAATASITEAADVLSSTGTITIVGTAAITEDGDVVVATIAPTAVTGVLSITEDSDTGVATATVLISGTTLVTEADDTVAAVGTVAIAGTSLVTEDGDTLAATSGLLIVGNVSIVEADDSLTSGGVLPLVGTLSSTEDGDSLTFTGIFGADLNIVEAPDVTTFFGALSITGVASSIQDPDTVQITTYLGPIIVPTPKGFAQGRLHAPYGWRVRRGRRERPDPYSW